MWGGGGVTIHDAYYKIRVQDHYVPPNVSNFDDFSFSEAADQIFCTIDLKAAEFHDI